MWEALDIWRFLAGLGIFLFGMHMLEVSIERLSGRAFKSLIRSYTQTRIRAILSGTLATVVLQSSSAVALMVLAFTGAGIISLHNAMGAIVGSNLGTTFKVWLIATLGFKMSIESLALPLIALGGIGLIFFTKSPNWVALAKLIAGFGFLFMGLDYMKNAVEDVTGFIDVAAWSLWPSIYFVGMGLILTGITQSSSASLVIVLSGVYSGLIGLEPACAFVIGANIGTTITVLLGSLGGSAVKKQVALSHITFNWITGTLMFIFLPLSLNLLDGIFGVRQDPVTGLAIFHTFFNLSGVILFFPFLSLLGRFTQWVIPDKKDIISRYIHLTDPTVPEAATLAIRHEALHLAGLVLSHNNKIVNLKFSLDYNKYMLEGKTGIGKSETVYQNIKTLKGQLYDLAHQIQQYPVAKEDAQILNHMLIGIRLLIFSAKLMKDIKHDFDDFGQRDEAIFDEINMHFSVRQERINRMVRNYFEEPERQENLFNAAVVFLESEENEFVRYYSNRAIELKIEPAVFSTQLIVNKI